MTTSLTDLDGRVALITGAARGQGEAEARLLAERGARVVVADVLAEPGRALADELGDAAVFVTLDVRSAAAWAATVATTVERFGRIDICVNNAGILRAGYLGDVTEQDFLDVVAVNQLGCFLGMQAVAPAMAEQGRGSIVNVSSIAGLQGVAGAVPYVATKWAIRGMTKAAAIELGPSGIRVNSVHPGVIDTPMTRGDVDAVDAEAVFAGFPLRRIGTADEVAEMVAFLASDASAYCTGAEFIVDGGASAGRPPAIAATPGPPAPGPTAPGPTAPGPEKPGPEKPGPEKETDR